MNHISERIHNLRKEMKREGIDVYIVPTADFHQSEYVGDFFKAREYMTGFTGSAGTAVFTQMEARLWTDGRYFVQATNELDGTEVELMKSGEPDVVTIEEYLEETLFDGAVLGFDGRVVSSEDGKKYEQIIGKYHGFIKYEQDLMDCIWLDRPSISKEPVFVLDIKYSGESVADKLDRVRAFMKEKNAKAHILTTLDDICWLFNIRGNDIAYFPMVLSYALITEDAVSLYVDASKFTQDIYADLTAAGVRFQEYNQIYEDIKQFSEESLLYDSAKLNYMLAKNIPTQITLIDEPNPEIRMKAIKNDVEIANIRKAHIKDSVAHIRFMKWLKEHYCTDAICELTATDKLDEFRKEMGGFIQPSFDPISAYGEHGAMCHYSSTPETDVVLTGGTLYLTDTGAGFVEGSTDITRTYALGKVPDVMREHFTIVTMANLRLAEAKFIYGASGANLDILARQPFWERGLNFNHGTGHGVGYLLSIHEGPASLCWLNRPSCNYPLEKGMILTDEPGIYIEGSHGIRLENELLVCEGPKTDFGQFMYFDTLTYIPFDLDAIIPEMLSLEDKRRLNAYHKKVYEMTSSFLDEEEKQWLLKYTREI